MSWSEGPDILGSTQFPDASVPLPTTLILMFFMILSQIMAVPPIFFECFNPQSWLLWIVGGFVSSLQSYTPMFLTGPMAYFVPNWPNGLPKGYFRHLNSLSSPSLNQLASLFPLPPGMVPPNSYCLSQSSSSPPIPMALVYTFVTSYLI